MWMRCQDHDSSDLVVGSAGRVHPPGTPGPAAGWRPPGASSRYLSSVAGRWFPDTAAMPSSEVGRGVLDFFSCSVHVRFTEGTLARG